MSEVQNNLKELKELETRCHALECRVKLLQGFLMGFAEKTGEEISEADREFLGLPTSKQLVETT